MKKLQIIVPRNPVYTGCPGCKKTESLHKSKSRSMVETFLKAFTFFNVYRCNSCGWRGILSTITMTKKSLVNLFYYGVIMVVIAFVVKFILSRSDWNL